jgi:hypothetical protein
MKNKKKLQSMCRIIVLFFLLILIYSCGTKAGKMYSCEYKMNSNLFDSLLIEFLHKKEYKIQCSPKKPCMYKNRNTYRISIPIEDETTDTFILEFTVWGYIEPKNTFFSVWTGAKKGELIKQSGSMTNKERKEIIDIFNSYIVTPFNEFLYEKQINVEILDCEKSYYFWE